MMLMMHTCSKRAIPAPCMLHAWEESLPGNTTLHAVLHLPWHCFFGGA